METEVSTIIFSSLIIFAIAWGAIVMALEIRRRTQQNNKLVNSLQQEIRMTKVEAQERQRESIARNLHDEANLILTIHKQSLEKICIDISNKNFNESELKMEVANCEEIRQALTSCISNGMPANVRRVGLLKALNEHVIRLNNCGKIAASFSFTETSKISRLFYKRQKTEIYRMCLELINNLIKHAQPDRITVTLQSNSGGLIITFDHNGTRVSNVEIADLLENSKGLGLRSIDIRSKILDANVNYSTEPGDPAVKVVIPVRKGKKGVLKRGNSRQLNYFKNLISKTSIHVEKDQSSYS